MITVAGAQRALAQSHMPQATFATIGSAIACYCLKSTSDAFEGLLPG